MHCPDLLYTASGEGCAKLLGFRVQGAACVHMCGWLALP